jgi:hypothetical protein
MKKEKKEKKLKSYILWKKLTTYERAPLGHHIKLVQTLATW